MASVAASVAMQSGPITASAAAHCATRSPYSDPSSVRRATKRTTISTSTGTGEGVTSNVEQSMSRAWPSTADAMHSWSMMPVGTPVARCSARCASRARSSGEPRCPNAIAAATSRAALDDRPAPTGMVVDTVPRMPVVAREFGCDRGDVPPPSWRDDGGIAVDGELERGRIELARRRELDPAPTLDVLDLGPPIDRHRKDESTGVVGVVPDQVHAPRRPDELAHGWSLTSSNSAAANCSRASTSNGARNARLTWSAPAST